MEGELNEANMKLVDPRMDQQGIRHKFTIMTYVPSPFSSTRAGKGVFSAMKLGKIKISKDDHKKGGKTPHRTVPA